MDARAPRGLAAALTLLLLLPLAAFGQEKRPLDHSDYDRWNRIQQQAISPDGAWVHYRLVPGHGDATLHLRTTDGERLIAVERGRDASFTRDSRYVVVRIEPMLEAREAARNGGAAPRDSLGIVELATGNVTRLDRLRAFTVPDESSEWVAIHRAAPRPDRDAEPEEEPEEEPQEERPEEEREERPSHDKPNGSDLHYRSLVTGQEVVLTRVTSYELTDDGTRIVWAAASDDGDADGVFTLAAGESAPTPLLTGEGAYTRLTFSDDERLLAFHTTRDMWEEEDAYPSVYLAEPASGAEARHVASIGSAGIPSGWTVSEHGSLSFSDDGSRLFFGTAPLPAPEPDEEDEMLENVTVDIWSWHDDFLQPHQLVDLDSERRRTYQAVAHLGADRIVQLEDTSLLSVNVPDGGNAAVALGQDELPYRQIVSWDTRFVDLYRVDVATGERELLVEKVRNSGSISPEGRFLFWWDGGNFEGTLPRGWRTLELATGEERLVTEAVPHPVYSELDDRTAPPGSYGLGGWTAGDEWMVVNDAHDLWLVDPRGRDAPRSLTAGYGRANDLRLRIVRLDWDDPNVPLDEEILLSAFHNPTKADGYYRARLDRGEAPSRIVLEDASFGSLAKAEDADRILFTRSTFEEFPDVWVANPDFGDRRRLSHANPQQEEVLWGTAELVTWTSADGEELHGILYKPENFDPAEEWPMMVYFYERSSQSLHGHYVPSTGTSINRSFYVSRGYLLFVPDIPYKGGYPGESAMNAVVPGITSIVDQGFVDRERIGVQGHSWGGYQIAYMVTRTNIFAAAEAGAPVSNMTSAYGGIRWASGRVRQMQYETGQSRIGGSLWEAQHRFIENSPLFTAYKVETPLLMVHNDEDGAVPWEEGIQFFVALRRLQRPVWLVNYNGQGHGVSGRFPQLDWTIRMQQFFDHYLVDAPPPEWMVHGVPALAKGRTLGLDLVTDETAVDRDDNDGGR